jgi:hypothetical protein
MTGSGWGDRIELVFRHDVGNEVLDRDLVCDVSPTEAPAGSSR